MLQPDPLWEAKAALTGTGQLPRAHESDTERKKGHCSRTMQMDRESWDASTGTDPATAASKRLIQRMA